MVPCCVKAQSPVWISFGFLIVLECVVLSALQEVLLVPEKSCRWSSLVLSLVHRVVYFESGFSFSFTYILEYFNGSQMCFFDRVLIVD